MLRATQVFKIGLLKQFILVFSLLAFTKSNGQVFSKANPSRKIKGLPKVYAGVKLGSNFSYLSGKNWDNGVKSNMLGGLFAGIKGGGFGVQLESVFEQSDFTTGSNFYQLYKTYYNDLSDSLTKGNFRVNKLCLPILIQMRIARLVWLQTGVQFYGVVNVKDNSLLMRDANFLFRNGNTSGIFGATVRLGNADIGTRLIVDFQSLNNLSSSDVWRQYVFQAHVGIKLF
jgi:hypothetical protein